MRALFRRPAGPTGAWAKLFNWFARAHAYYFSLPRLQFEAMTLGFALLFGLLVMPLLIYIPGYYVLRPYANGGRLRPVRRLLQGAVRASPELLDRSARSLSFS
jgi:hypothetical protein